MSNVVRYPHPPTSATQPRLLEVREAFEPVETYSRVKPGMVARHVRKRDGSLATTTLRASHQEDDLSSSFDRAWLRQEESTGNIGHAETYRLVDLFAGGGGLTLGVVEAGKALGLSIEPVLAVDTDERALGVYGENFPSAALVSESIDSLLDSDLGSPLSPNEEQLRESLGRVDIVVGGPPCQGHSSLNNHTRFSDSRNRLYAKMARFAEVVGPTHIIIENVPGVVQDTSGVVDQTREALKQMGYHLSTSVMRGEAIGIAQTRHRFFTLASREVQPDLPRFLDLMKREARPLSWAIDDLVGVEADTVYDTSSVHSEENQRRIQFLFENGLHDLPDSERPDCHRLKNHSYLAVYGRLYWDRPAPTITRGFAYTGRGRFVHPLEPRTLTPHEAARVQFFPDFYSFGNASRSILQNIIGNAVPPKMGYVAALELLR